jgi:hypothetical protein
VAGIFADHSFASSDRSERDIFLEKVYRVESDGTWEAVPMTGGVWIHGNALMAIEFMAFQE